MSVIIKLGIGFITSKVIAIFVCPSGMALIGNFRNFVGTFETLSTLGTQNGMVKYIAENRDDKKIVKHYISTIFISVLSVSLLLSVTLFFLFDFWNYKIFGLPFDYSFVFKTFAFALPFYALSLVLIAIINGFGQFKKVIYINIIGNIIGMLVSVVFIYYLNILGALLSIIITPSLLFLVSYYHITKEINITEVLHFKYFDFNIIKGLAQYFLMALVAGIFGSIVSLLVRKHIIVVIGIVQAGYWEAMTRISTYYLLFISTILTVYFLPKIAIAKSNHETKKVFWSYYKTVFPLFLLGIIVIYFSRFFILKLMLSAQFLPVSALFFWQLLGDVLKMASWILGYQFFAKKTNNGFYYFGDFFIINNLMFPVFF